MVDNNLKKTYEKISEEAKKEKAINEQKDKIFLSAINMKPMQPILNLVRLKDFSYF